LDLLSVGIISAIAAERETIQCTAMVYPSSLFKTLLFSLQIVATVVVSPLSFLSLKHCCSLFKLKIVIGIEDCH
jgi:hypothetical protein